MLTSAIAWLSLRGSDDRSMLNGRPAMIATHSGGSGQTVMAALRLRLPSLGAAVMGRLSVCHDHHPDKNDSIDNRIQQVRLVGTPKRSVHDHASEIAEARFRTRAQRWPVGSRITHNG